MKPSSPAPRRPAEDPESGHESRTPETRTWASCESARLRGWRRRPGPLHRGQYKCARADARLERTQTDMARQKAPALEEDLLSCPGWPLLYYSLSLAGYRDKLIERIYRGVQAQKSFLHSGEQKAAAADILLFVELNCRFDASHKTGADARAHLSNGRPAFYALHS